MFPLRVSRVQDVSERLTFFEGDEHSRLVDLVRLHHARKLNPGKDERELGHKSWNT